MANPQNISCIREVLSDYDVLLIDAFGVLMHQRGALPGARAFVDYLHHQQRDYCILTNGASFTLEQQERNYRGKGLEIPAANILTSGSILGEWIETEGLAGQSFLVLGSSGTEEIVHRSGGLVAPLDSEDYDVLVAGNLVAGDFIGVMDGIITRLFRMLDRQKPPRFVLPNPDYLYPKSESELGLTSGAVAHLIEGALALRKDGSKLDFVRLGKPHSRIFDAAKRRFPGKRLLMIGDQLATDIKGALLAGIDSVLVGTGVETFAVDVASKLPQDSRHDRYGSSLGDQSESGKMSSEQIHLSPTYVLGSGLASFGR